MLVVDTSVWIDYFRGANTPAVARLDAELERTRILIPDLVLAEILRGVQTEKMAKNLQARLSDFQSIDVGGVDIAIKAAANYRKLRASGITIRGTIDLLIATWCIENAVPLLHDDRDFNAMEQHLSLQTF
jgi:predicted nucleic acid-binding protein